MFTKLALWITSLFPKSKLGVILSLLVTSAGSALMKEIMDPDNQKMAYEFVKKLNNRSDLTNAQKAKEFNKQMLAWAGKIGKKMATSAINCLRELAVNALKAERIMLAEKTK